MDCKLNVRFRPRGTMDVNWMLEFTPPHGSDMAPTLGLVLFMPNSELRAPTPAPVPPLPPDAALFGSGAY